MYNFRYISLISEIPSTTLTLTIQSYQKKMDTISENVVKTSNSFWFTSCTTGGRVCRTIPDLCRFTKTFLQSAHIAEYPEKQSTVCLPQGASTGDASYQILQPRRHILKPY